MEILGATVSTRTLPFEEYEEKLSSASFAFTLKYQVASDKVDECVNEFVLAAEVDTPELKPESCDHSTVYVSLLAKPEPESVEAVQVQVGVVSLVGVVVDGVPGVVGPVVSTVKVSEP